MDGNAPYFGAYQWVGIWKKLKNLNITEMEIFVTV
jgi:hypothetical protein